jgi:putative ABC transport system substrate-binding protein
LPAPTPTPKIFRIGFLVATAPVATIPGGFSGGVALGQGLRDLGRIEGKDFVFEYRYAEGNADRLPVLAAELIALKVDILVTTGPLASVVAKNATSTIPIVFVGGGDPVGTNLVASFAQPGGNVTGVTSGATLVTGKRLELLKELIPGISRVAVPLSPNTPSANWKETQEAAKQLGLELQLLEYQKPEDFERVLAAAMSRRPEALFVIDNLEFVIPARMAELATQSRLPSSFILRDVVIGGGFMSYGANAQGYYYRAATYVDKILKGAKPADLPVENPTKFDFVINLKTSKALGLTIPSSVLAQATEVIQ